MVILENIFGWTLVHLCRQQNGATVVGGNRVDARQSEDLRGYLRA